MSVVVSIVSSNTVLGVPPEVYGYGSTYIWYGISSGIGFFFASPPYFSTHSGGSKGAPTYGPFFSILLDFLKNVKNYGVDIPI